MGRWGARCSDIAVGCPSILRRSLSEEYCELEVSMVQRVLKKSDHYPVRRLTGRHD